jgi:hypothetical protein
MYTGGLGRHYLGTVRACEALYEVSVDVTVCDERAVNVMIIGVLFGDVDMNSFFGARVAPY